MDGRTDIRNAEQAYNGDGRPNACNTERIRGGDHRGIPIIIRSVTAFPRSVDVVFLVRSSLNARVIGTPHPYWTCARVGGGGCYDSAASIFISVYIPTESQGEPYRGRLREELAQLREKFLGIPSSWEGIGISMKESWMLCCGVGGVYHMQKQFGRETLRRACVVHAGGANTG
jgi:hypothetical protein